MIIFSIIFVIIIAEYYSYQAIKRLFNNKGKKGWIIFSIISFLVILIGFYFITLKKGDRGLIHFIMGLFTLIYIPKITISIILIIEDIFRIFSYIANKINNQGKKENFLPSRRKSISLLSLGVASIPFLSIIEGIKWGKFDYRIKKITLFFPDLPDLFDGYKIVQISDLHLGSFNLNNADKVKKGFDLINEQTPDLFVFTGDIVNNVAEEMIPWLSLLKNIKSKDGNYAILGNHDYGIYEYGKDNIIAQQKNITDIDNFYKKINWELLRNQNIQIKRKNQHINLIGIENWGKGAFPKYGNLKKSSENISSNEFSILLSHDPSFFDETVKNFSKKIHLSLSGHTHGMQFGVEIPGVIKWSPIKYRYPKWAGLYKENNRFLYVNRGFGFIGFPGRIGIWPEITVIELKKS